MRDKDFGRVGEAYKGYAQSGNMECLCIDGILGGGGKCDLVLFWNFVLEDGGGEGIVLFLWNFVLEDDSGGGVVL